MTAWNRDQRAALDSAYSILLAAGAREPGGPQVEIGVVVVGEDCFVRAYRGAASEWYRAALRHGMGRITVDGASVEVLFSPADAALSAQIDAAYSRKYGAFASLASGSAMKEATLLIRPAG